MIAQLLRFADIILFTMLVCLIVYGVWETRLRTRVESTRIHWLLLLLMLGGVAVGMGDLLTAPLSPAVRTIPSRLTISGTVDFNVAWDVTGTNIVTSVEWGELKPGDTAQKTVYILNKSNSNIWCRIDASSWVPPTAGEYLTLTWDFSEAPLGSQRARKALIELHVSEDTPSIENFTFDIIITAGDEPFTG